MDYEIVDLLIGIIFTFCMYSCYPLYLRVIKNKRFVEPRKICIKNSIIVCIIDSILAFWLESEMNFTPAFVYYFINYQILKAPRYMITRCQLCGADIIKNEHNTCEDCHNKIMQRLANKEIEKQIEQQKFCSHCGTKLEKNDSFCCNCGNKVKE